jgi:hypothetical protein
MLSIGMGATCTVIRTGEHIGIVACSVCRNRWRTRCLHARITIRAMVSGTITTRMSF